MNNKRTMTRQSCVEKIKHELLALGPMRPGSLSRQWNVCGKPDCRCKDLKRPHKHGPYYQLSYTWRGRSRTVFIPQDKVTEVKTQIATYRRFRELCQEWVDVALALVSPQTLKKRSGKMRSAKAARIRITREV
jgi:hypothetical protein